jgi:hypothetical protein
VDWGLIVVGVFLNIILKRTRQPSQAPVTQAVFEGKAGLRHALSTDLWNGPRRQKRAVNKDNTEKDKCVPFQTYTPTQKCFMHKSWSIPVKKSSVCSPTIVNHRFFSHWHDWQPILTVLIYFEPLSSSRASRSRKQSSVNDILVTESDQINRMGNRDCFAEAQMP